MIGSPTLLCDQVNTNAAITVAVLASLVALLSAFVIALFASKRFRDFFFKDKPDSTKAKPQTHSAASSAKKPDGTAKRSTASGSRSVDRTSKNAVGNSAENKPKTATKSATAKAPGTRKSGR